MNISSIIVHIKDENLMDEVLNLLSSIPQCEIVAYEDKKIVALICAKDFDEELGVFKSIEQTSGVVGVAMVYSYQEDLDGDLEKLKANGKLSEVLTNDDMNASDIVYSGSIHHKVR